MNFKASESKARMTLRKLSKRTLKESCSLAPEPLLKEKKKVPKGIRRFGTEITNQPRSMEVEMSHQIAPQEPSVVTGQDWEPYMKEIVSHISIMDWKYHSTALSWIRSSNNKEITPQMRSILIKWLIQVGDKFRVNSETLHICIQIIDYVLTKGFQISKSTYQLLGITSLFVASKYNEISIPDAEKYVFVCDGQYDCAQLFDMEAMILIATDFNLQIPTVVQFADHLAQQHDLPEEGITLVKSLSNLCVFDFNLFNKYKKADLASVVLYLASKILGLETVKSRALIEQIGVEETTFRECLLCLIAIYKDSNRGSLQTNQFQ